MAVQKVYKYCNEENCDMYINHIRKNCGQGSSGLTFKDALINPEYRQATWVNIGYIIFHELTSINVIMMYSNTLFREMQKPGKVADITPRVGTYLVGVSNAVSSLMGTQTVKCFDNLGSSRNGGSPWTNRIFQQSRK